MVSVCTGVYSVVALLPKFTSEESAQRNPWTIGHGFQPISDSDQKRCSSERASQISASYIATSSVECLYLFGK